MLALIAVSAQAAPHRADPAPVVVQIPLALRTAATATPSPATMHAQVFKPHGPGPFKVLLYAHGRPAYASGRAQLKRPVHARHVQYWLAKGYAVVAPIRPGYGITGGADQESSGAGYTSKGQCIRSPQPERAAQAAASAQREALDWVRQQAWARPDHIVLEGQSVGGLTTVALCASNPPGVRGCINFSGGAGGDPQHASGNMCAPEKLTQLMQGYGQTTRAPSMWLYAPNDLYWGPTAPGQWHRTFNQTAALHPPASPAAWYQSPPIGSDGHSLQRAGSKHWAPVLNAWLAQHKL